jgi:RimJ/RimL family protein N-acetyltransferase
MFGPGESLPCGYGEINPMRTDPGHSWLGHLLIDPARRGTGLGSRLTNELVRWAFDLGGAGRLSLVVFPENLPAVACYHRCGFQLRGEETQQFNNQGPRHTLLRFEMFAPKFEGVAAERSATVAPESADSANR